MTEQLHNCTTCAKKVPECGRKRRQLEGHCLDWQPKERVEG